MSYQTMSTICHSEISELRERATCSLERAVRDLQHVHGIDLACWTIRRTLHALVRARKGLRLTLDDLQLLTGLSTDHLQSRFGRLRRVPVQLYKPLLEAKGIL